MKRALLAGLTIAIVVSCGGPALHSTNTSEMSPAELARAQAEFEPFAPAFQSLEAALSAHDDELALRILTRILARDPRGVALERAQAFERILEGRAWIATLRLRLETQRLENSDEWLVHVVANNSNELELTLRGAPPTLRTNLLGVNPDGLEQRFSQQNTVDALARWSLPPGVETRLEIGKFSIPPGQALAVRAVFTLDFLPGEVLRGGEVRPAASVPVVRGEAVRLASFLPAPPLQPEELVRYISHEMIRMPLLLERTVRIPLEQRARALDLLTPVALELPSSELEKLTVALRWLSGQSQIGADAGTWRQWLDQRAKLRERDRREGRQSAGELELPDDRSYRQ